MMTDTLHIVWSDKEMQVYTQLRAKEKKPRRRIKEQFVLRACRGSSRHSRGEENRDWHLKASEGWAVSWGKQGQNENEEVEVEGVGETDKTV